MREQQREQPIRVWEERPLDDTDPRDVVLWEAVNKSPTGSDGPYIWVGTVVEYLSGQPHGRWISAAQPVRDIERDIAAMAARAPSADENSEPARWHIFSHAGFGRHEPDADSPLGEIVRRAERYREELRAYSAWAWLGGDDWDWLMRFPQAYQGRYDRLRDWVNLEVERAGYDRLLDSVVPDTIRPHVAIDIDSLAHELRESGAVATAKDPERPGVFVFQIQ